MAAFNQEIVYYNTFWLKHVTTPVMGNNNNNMIGGSSLTNIDVQRFHAVFPGLPYKGYSGTSTNLVV